MHCPHCGHPAGFWSQFSFRVDGGCRCTSCRNVFFVEAGESKWPFAFIRLLILVAFVVGLFLVLLFEIEIAKPWVVVVGCLGFLVAIIVTNHFQSSKVRKVTYMPPAILWRRRCFSYGSLIFTVAQIAAFLSRPYVPADDWTHYIQIAGSTVFFVFILAGRARRPSHDPDVVSN